MTFQLDHVVISVQDLQAAINNFSEAGFTVIKGGKHTSSTTENALIAFADGTYIELLAPTHDEPSGIGMDFSPLVNPEDGFTGFALLSADLEADAGRIAGSSIPIQKIVPGNRQKPDGTEIRWKLAILEGTMSPFLIQDVTDRKLRVSSETNHITHNNGVQGISNLTIATTHLEAAQMRYKAILGTSTDKSVYTLTATTISLMPATTVEHHQHIKTFGETPYEITFVSTQGKLITRTLHGACMKFL